LNHLLIVHATGSFTSSGKISTGCAVEILPEEVNEPVPPGKKRASHRLEDRVDNNRKTIHTTGNERVELLIASASNAKCINSLFKIF
jgi:hypothetical protein